MKLTEAKINIILLGLLIGYFGFALVAIATLPPVLFILAILVIAFILKYKSSDRVYLAWLLGSVLVGILIGLLVPVLSPVALPVSTFAISMILIYLIVK